MVEFLLSKLLVKRLYSILLSIGAIIGVASLIIILSLFHNYYLSSEKVFMGIHPHIEIHKDMNFDEANNKIKLLKQKFSEIAAIQPALYLNVKSEISEVNRIKSFCVNEAGQLTCYSKKSTGEIITKFGFNIKEKQTVDFLLKGIQVEHDGKSVMDIKKLLDGSTDLYRLEQNSDENNNPIPFAFYIEEGVFKTLTGYFLIHFPGLSNTKFQYWLNGTINMGTRKGKYPLLIMSLNNAQKVLNKEDYVNTIEIQIIKPYNAEKISQAIQLFLGNNYKVENWIQKEKASFMFLTIIKWMIFSIIFSISLVAAISIFSTLYLTVLENRKKICILKALGMKNLSIYYIFLIKTLKIGFIGTTIGSISGYICSHYFILFFKESLEKLGLENPQNQITFNDISIIWLSTIILFLLTAIIPARNAVKIDTIEGLNQ